MANPTTAPKLVFDANLLARLQQRFTLTPNYTRPLSDRVVDQRLDGSPITEHDYVANRLAARDVAVYGGRIEQTWSWRVDGIAFQFNAAWEHCRHYGVQYASHCQRCGVTLWHRADRRPVARCPECRHDDVSKRTGRCPETGLACSTGYMRARCRCLACRAWHTRYHRRRRQRAIPTTGTRLPGDTPASIQTLLSQNKKRSIALPEKKSTGLSRVCMENTDGPSAWVWLPADVRAVLVEYCRDWEAYVDAITAGAAVAQGRKPKEDPARRGELATGDLNGPAYWQQNREHLNVET